MTNNFYWTVFYEKKSTFTHLLIKQLRFHCPRCFEFFLEFFGFCCLRGPNVPSSSIFSSSFLFLSISSCAAFFLLPYPFGIKAIRWGPRNARVGQILACTICEIDRGSDTAQLTCRRGVPPPHVLVVILDNSWTWYVEIWALSFWPPLQRIGRAGWHVFAYL